MIIIGIGANLPAPGQMDARSTCLAALAELRGRGIVIGAVSPWYESEPVPRSDQPWYVNAVVEVRDSRPPQALMAVLHEVEAVFGRVRGVPNAARTLDLDLLDHDGRVATGDAWPVLPHPRLQERAFVLLPLRDIAPDWVHPVLNKGIDALIRDLPEGQGIRRLPGRPGS